MLQIELNVAGDAIFSSPSDTARLSLTSRNRASIPQQESKEQLTTSTAAPADNESSDEEADSKNEESSSRVEDLLKLAPLPARSVMKSPAAVGLVNPPNTRHRTNLYLESKDTAPTEVFCTAFSTDSRSAQDINQHLCH